MRIPRWGLVVLLLAALGSGGILGFVGNDLRRDDFGQDREVACSVMFAGTITPDLDHQPRCIGEDGNLRSVGSHRWVCTDGSELFVNDYGYGVNGDPWHADSGVIAQRLGSRGPGTPDPNTPFGKVVRGCQQP
jgi:hypothetical protein